MYNLIVNPNRVLVVLALAAGLACVFYYPQQYPDKIVEIPLLALFVGEVGLALFCSLLFYENASTEQIVKLTASVLGFSMLVGSVGNSVAQLSQMLPDSLVLISWVQLVIMNVAGIACTLSLFKLQLPGEPPALKARLIEPSSARAAPGEPSPAAPAAEPAAGAPVAEHDFSPPTAAPPAEVKPRAAAKAVPSVKEILESLDISRIMRLERSLHPEEKPSLETLFKEESKAAEAATARQQPEAIILGGQGKQESGTPRAIDFAPRTESPAQLTVSAGQPEACARLDKEAEASQPGAGTVPAPGATSAEPAEVSGGPEPPPPDGGEPAAAPSEQPSLKELLAAEPLTGPLAPLDAEAEASPDTVAEPEKVFEEEVAGEEIDDAFAKLVSKEALRQVSAETLAQLRGETGQSEAAALPAARPQTEPPKDVKDFGRLSAKASAKGSEDVESSGGMKTLGKMLIDTQAVENIIKRGGGSGGITTARVVSAERGEAIRTLLTYVDSYPGVGGSMIIGNDGLVIATTMELSKDKDVLAAMSLAIQNSSDIAAGKLSLGVASEIILQSAGKLTVLRKLDDGILAVFSDRPGAASADGLLKAIANVMKVKSRAEGDDTSPPNPAAASAATGLAQAAAALPAEPATQDKPAPAAGPDRQSEPAAAAAPVEAPPLPPAQPEAAEEPVAVSPAETGAPEPGPTTPTRAAVAADQVRELLASLSNQPTEKAETAPAGQDAPTSGLEAQPAAAEQANAAPGESQHDKAVAEPSKSPAAPIKEFGRLSQSSGSYQAVGQDTPGSMKSIGKMLLDVQAVSNIIKSAEKRGAGLTTARVISAARGEGIRALLKKIDDYPGVAGCLIVGHDGLVIASTLEAGMDKDVLGAMAISVHSHTDVATKKLELGSLNQSIFQSAARATVFTNVDVGILAVFWDSPDPGKLDGLLEAIEATVKG